MKLSIFTGCSLATVLTVGVALSACSEEQPPQAQSAQPQPAAASPAATTPAAPPPEAAPAAPAAASTFTPEALETLLAPVALYPDAVLAQVLAASTNPQEVLDAGNWLVANPDMEGDKLDAATSALGFTPPMMALMHFPTVVDMMCMEMDWTTELGTAFQTDEAGVLDAVQRLRKQASEMGTLKTSEQMKVVTEERNDQPVIVVQPANPEVIYVPQYNPTTVYTTPAPAVTTVPAATTSTTTIVDNDGYSGGEMITAGLLAFGAGILVNEVFDDDDDDNYYSPNWGYGGGGYYPPPYYPRYGNGYRPANVYNRPANYQRGFNNNNIYVDADGKDYFNRFEGGRNNYLKDARSPISQARPNRPELGELNQRAQNIQRPATRDIASKPKVQGTYAGAAPDARAKIAGASQRPAVKAPTGAYKGADPAARQKLNPQTAGARDRGHAAATQAKANIQPKNTAKQSRPADAKVSRPSVPKQGGAKVAAKREPAKRPSGFQGSRNSGKAERAASQRGRASMQQGRNRSGGGDAGRGRRK
jgi:hypothetical protein